MANGGGSASLSPCKHRACGRSSEQGVDKNIWREVARSRDCPVPISAAMEYGAPSGWHYVCGINMEALDNLRTNLEKRHIGFGVYNWMSLALAVANRR